ncbi:MAG: hypothetical protein E7608_00400 [Ruminococcaceae bacterium]|nr:hypothetical protein [Oscillospiraceae bacterium]
MKKLISILLALAMLLTFTSCSDNNTGETQTTEGLQTTEDPQAAVRREIQTCYKVVVNTVLFAYYVYPDTKIENESPNSKESLKKLTEKFIETLKIYKEHVGFSVCIEWRGEENADLISNIESEFPVNGGDCAFKRTTIFHFSMNDSDLPQDEYCEKLSELLYHIAQNDDVKRVLLSDFCIHHPVPA